MFRVLKNLIFDIKSNLLVIQETNRNNRFCILVPYFMNLCIFNVLFLLLLAMKKALHNKVLSIFKIENTYRRQPAMSVNARQSLKGKKYKRQLHRNGFIRIERTPKCENCETIKKGEFCESHHFYCAYIATIKNRCYVMHIILF